MGPKIFAYMGKKFFSNHFHRMVATPMTMPKRLLKLTPIIDKPKKIPMMLPRKGKNNNHCEKALRISISEPRYQRSITSALRNS